MPELTARMDVPTGPEIRQQVGPVQRLAESLYEVASGLRIRGHAVAASGVEEAAFAAVLWSDRPVASAVAPERPSTAPVDLPAVLSSVDDVQAVCEAAGVRPQGRNGWGERGLFVSIDSWHDGELASVIVDRTSEHVPFAQLNTSASGALLYAAIQAARGGESDV